MNDHGACRTFFVMKLLPKQHKDSTGVFKDIYKIHERLECLSNLCVTSVGIVSVTQMYSRTLVRLTIPFSLSLV